MVHFSSYAYGIFCTAANLYQSAFLRTRDHDWCAMSGPASVWDTGSLPPCAMRIEPPLEWACLRQKISYAFVATRLNSSVSTTTPPHFPISPPSPLVPDPSIGDKILSVLPSLSSQYKEYKGTRALSRKTNAGSY